MSTATTMKEKIAATIAADLEVSIEQREQAAVALEKARLFHLEKCRAVTKLLDEVRLLKPGVLS